MGGTLSIRMAFGVIQAFLVIQMPVKELTDFLIKYDEAKVSIKRIEKFLLEDEIDASHIIRLLENKGTKFKLAL